MDDPTSFTLLVKAALELGVTGLLFVMWWYERKDRISTDSKLDKATTISISFENMSKELMTCIKENTTATVKLLERIEKYEESLVTKQRR